MDKIFIVNSFSGERCPMCSIVGAYIDEATAAACAATDRRYYVEAIPFYGKVMRGDKIYVVEEYSHERTPDLEYTEAYSDESEVIAATKTRPITLDSISYCTINLE